MRKPLENILAFCFFLSAQVILAQPLDSLQLLLENATTEEERVSLYVKIANATIRTDKVQALTYAKEAEAIAMFIEDMPLLAKSRTTVGRIYPAGAGLSEGLLWSVWCLRYTRTLSCIRAVM